MYNKKPPMENITLNIPQLFFHVIDKLREHRLVYSRSEAVREALKEFIEKEKENQKLFQQIPGKHPGMKIISAHIPVENRDFIDKLVRSNHTRYTSNSELIREALKFYLLHKLKEIYTEEGNTKDFLEKNGYKLIRKLE